MHPCLLFGFTINVQNVIGVYAYQVIQLIRRINECQKYVKNVGNGLAKIVRKTTDRFVAFAVETWIAPRTSIMNQIMMIRS